MKKRRLLGIVLSLCMVLALMPQMVFAEISDGSTTPALTGRYATNPNNQFGVNKTISVDGEKSDWESSMLIAQGTANDDPRVYRDNSMYEIAMDDYALYAAWDNANLYLMWEMANVQDIVAPKDDFPISQGNLWINNMPFFIAINTGLGNVSDGTILSGGTLCDSRISYTTDIDTLIVCSTNNSNGPFIYTADENGKIGDAKYSGTDTGINMKWGNAKTLSNELVGVNGAYGSYNNRIPGDTFDDSSDWVDFYNLGHDARLDMFYEMSIPLEKLGITTSDIETNGIGIMKISTFGISGMDSLPYDPSMSDNADKPYSGQENNSNEKEDEDNITVPLARIGNALSSGNTDPDTLAISGIEDGKTYCDTVQFEVSTISGSRIIVKANGERLTADDNGKYSLEKGSGEVEVFVKDDEGNERSVSVTVNNGHIDNDNDHKCDICTACVHEDTDDNHKCDYCDEILSDHTGGTATCQKKAVCEICKQEYGDYAEHTLIKTEAKAASCTENGNSEYWTCSVCKNLFSDENGTTETKQDAVTIRANGHTLNKIDAKEATAAETGNIEYWQCENCKECFSDKDGKNSIELADTVISKRSPEIIEGKGQSITAGEKKALSFTSNADFKEFREVQLDGKTLDEKNYTVKEGSTIVTLNADYVATLSAGKHTIGIISERGTATTTFTVVEKADAENSAKTGDDTNIALWLALMLLSGAGITGVTAYTRRKRTNE